MTYRLLPYNTFYSYFHAYNFFLITGKAEEPVIVWNLTPAGYLGT